MLKFAALAGVATVLMAVPAQAHKVVKTKVINPPGPGIVVKKTVVQPVPVVRGRASIRTVIVNPPGPKNTTVRRVVVTKR